MPPGEGETVCVIANKKTYGCEVEARKNGKSSTNPSLPLPLLAGKSAEWQVRGEGSEALRRGEE